MSATFIALALIAAILLVNWRLVLLVLTACLVALIAMGLGVAGGEPAATDNPAATAPADAGPGVVDDGAPTN